MLLNRKISIDSAAHRQNMQVLLKKLLGPIRLRNCGSNQNLFNIPLSFMMWHIRQQRTRHRMVNKCDGINCFGYLNQKRSDFILPRIGCIANITAVSTSFMASTAFSRVLGHDAHQRMGGIERLQISTLLRR